MNENFDRTEQHNMNYSETVKVLKKNAKAPLVSIIVPVYNVDKYLARCLDSLINQTLTDFEIICVNDGSTDDSLAILNKYAIEYKTIKVYNKANGGAASARNFGLKKAVGEYVMFVDSDDWIETDTLEKTVPQMVGDVDFVSWGALIDVNRDIIIDQEIENLRNYLKVKVPGEVEINDNSVSRATITVWNKLLKKEIIEKYNILFLEGMLFEDNAFMIEYFVHCRNGYFLDEYFYHYFIRTGSIMDTVRGGNCNRSCDYLHVFDSIYKHLVNCKIAQNWPKTLTNTYSGLLNQAYKYAPDGKKQEIRKLATELALKYDGSLFASDCISNVIKGNYEKVREMNEFIVSLTSYPKRISTVHITIRSILAQSVKASKVVLWLTEDEFPKKEEELPKELLQLKQEGLIISWCGDLKSYNKLIPSLQVYPDAVIITADDDIIYDRDWLKLLIESYVSNPDCIHCHRSDKIAIENGVVLPYIKWLNHDSLKNTVPSYLLMVTGVAGVLYPAHCFNANVFNFKKMTELCPNNDDVWFWGNALLNGIKIHMISGAQKNPTYIEGTQEIGMWRTHNKFNDVTGNCIRSFLEAYPLAKRILMYEYANEQEKLALEKRLEKASKELEENNIKNKIYQAQISRLENGQKHLKSSISFKVGRGITWLPRMIRDFVRKYL